MTTLDTSAPLATLLRLSTASAHDAASNSQGAGWLTRGELDREEYIRFLMMLYHIYDVFERALDENATHPVLQPTYNPLLLARAASLATDIATLLQTPQAQWQTHPIHVELMAAPPLPFTQYLARLRLIVAAGPADAQRLLAHSYVRYLGDLSGGQFVKRVLAKVYGLENGDGLSFYEFRQLGGNGSATIGDMKKIKEWFREGMNAGAGDDQAVKLAIADEAKIAFDLNRALFTILRPPTNILDVSLSPASPPLGEPSTPSEDSPLQAQRDASATPTYRVATVLAVIAALSLSHFLLVVNGLTGEKGATKLEAVQHWFANAFASLSSA
ncbi:hypothetical protein EUX98_g4719 [Antrodiella citrinella]|uniref:Heme oxygenase n=1 Tax=Antrodiella citrinella TaxID=2447956 RepID=A0A4S4MTC5_9APHY|nr:hypothetical protein EUX98_g4719 [Antrodiella citrinella]